MTTCLGWDSCQSAEPSELTTPYCDCAECESSASSIIILILSVSFLDSSTLFWGDVNDAVLALDFDLSLVLDWLRGGGVSCWVEVPGTGVDLWELSSSSSSLSLTGRLTVVLVASLACRPPTCLPLCWVICARRKSKWLRIHLTFSMSSWVPSPDFSFVSLMKQVLILLFQVWSSLHSVLSSADFSSHIQPLLAMFLYAVSFLSYSSEWSFIHSMISASTAVVKMMDLTAATALRVTTEPCDACCMQGVGVLEIIVDSGWSD